MPADTLVTGDEVEMYGWLHSGDLGNTGIGPRCSE